MTIGDMLKKLCALIAIFLITTTIFVSVQQVSAQVNPLTISNVVCNNAVGALIVTWSHTLPSNFASRGGTVTATLDYQTNTGQSISYSVLANVNSPTITLSTSPYTIREITSFIVTLTATLSGYGTYSKTYIGGCGPVSEVSLGTISGVNNAYTPISTGGTVTINTPYWMRIKMTNIKGSPTNLDLDEVINNSGINNYFVINNPLSAYSASNTSNYNFKIERVDATLPGSPTDYTCAQGGVLPSCVTAASASQVTLSLSGAVIPTAAADSIYIYLKVTPSKTSGSSVPLNNITATGVTYTPSGIKYYLNNNQYIVGSPPPSPYFTIDKGGNLFSTGNINNSLVSGKYISSSPYGIVMHEGSLSAGSGSISSSGWNTSSYAFTKDTTNMQYDRLRAFYSKYLRAVNLQTVAGFNDAQLTTLDMIEHVGTSNDLILNSSWTGTLSSKRLLIFVPGNLYITNGFAVQANGVAAITFVVKGNIGIDPSVTKVEGTYITDGVIDTVCSQSSAFQSDQTCAPASSAVSALELQGMYLTKSGFHLERNGTPGTIPGETFKFRPDFLLSGYDTIARIGYLWKEQIN